MKPVQALFTEDEMLAVRDALSEETVRMRQHVAITKQPRESRAGKRLATLEGLLSWAKEKCMR